MEDKLTKKEWKLCKKIKENIVKMKYTTVAQRANIIEYIKDKSKKYNYSLIQIPNSPKGTELWEYTLNDKKNYICFYLFIEKPPIIMPASIFEVNI